jgi:hypothetical protein
VEGLLDEPTISPAVYSGAIVVAVVTLPGAVVAVEPELFEQPIMVAHRIRKILRAINILADFSIHYHYSAGY